MGIDLSLTSTGISIIDEECKIIFQSLIKTTNTEIIENRIINVNNNIEKYITDNLPISIFMEGLSYQSKGQSSLELAALHYYLRISFVKSNLNFKVIPPTTLKRFICGVGKGQAKKELVLLKCFKKYGIEFDNNDLCDSYCLSRMCHEETKNSNN